MIFLVSELIAIDNLYFSFFKICTIFKNKQADNLDGSSYLDRRSDEGRRSMKSESNKKKAEGKIINF